MNGIDWNFDWSWFGLGTFGFFLGMALQFFKYQPRIIKEGGWKLGYFLKDNMPRLIAGFVLCLITSQIFQDTNPWLYLFSCIGFDRGVDSFTNRKK